MKSISLFFAIVFLITYVYASHEPVTTTTVPSNEPGYLSCYNQVNYISNTGKRTISGWNPFDEEQNETMERSLRNHFNPVQPWYGPFAYCDVAEVRDYSDLQRKQTRTHESVTLEDCSDKLHSVPTDLYRSYDGYNVVKELESSERKAPSQTREHLAGVKGIKRTEWGSAGAIYLRLQVGDLGGVPPSPQVEQQQTDEEKRYWKYQAALRGHEAQEAETCKPCPVSLDPFDWPVDECGVPLRDGEEQREHCKKGHEAGTTAPSTEPTPPCRSIGMEKGSNGERGHEGAQPSCARVCTASGRDVFRTVTRDIEYLFNSDNQQRGHEGNPGTIISTLGCCCPITKLNECTTKRLDSLRDAINDDQEEQEQEERGHTTAPAVTGPVTTGPAGSGCSTAATSTDPWCQLAPSYITYGTCSSKPLSNPSYCDGIGLPNGVTRANAREISNTLFSRAGRLGGRQVADMHTYFGLVITTDTGFYTRGSNEQHLIAIPTGDPFKDPDAEGCKVMYNFRAAFASGTGTGYGNPRLQTNDFTSFLDLSNIYGVDPITVCNMRSFEYGKLQNVYIVPDPEVATVPNPGTWLLRGDPRMNKIPTIAAIGQIWVDNHNRLAHKIWLEHRSWNDETIFQEARKWNIAMYQDIAVKEWLATLLGEPLRPYEGYNENANPNAAAMWSHAAMRYGHSEVATTIRRVDSRFTEIKEKSVLLRDNLWNIEAFTDIGVEPIIRGLTIQLQEAVDTAIVDDMRNFMFLGPLDGDDIAAINIQRGRDMGLPSYNDAREILGLQRKTSWSEVSSDQELVSILYSLYPNIDDADLWVAGLAEDPLNEGSNVGETFWNIHYNQFTRLRDGDPFWYEREGQFSEEELAEIYEMNWERIIELNSNITVGSLGEGTFFSKSRQLATLVADGVVGDFEFFEDAKPLSFDDNYIQLSSIFKLWWRIEGDEIYFKGEILATGWFGLGLNPDPNTMKGADIYWCMIHPNGTVNVRDSFALDVGPPTLDTDIPNTEGKRDFGTDDVKIIYDDCYERDGHTVIAFKRKLKTKDEWDADIKDEDMRLIFSFNPDTDALVYHGPTRNADTIINFYKTRYDTWELETWIKVLIGVFASLAIVYAIILLIAVGVKSQHFKFMSPLFSGIVIIGAIICLSAAYTLLKDEPTNTSCSFYVWLVTLGFAICFGALFAKTWRLWRLFSNKSMKAKVITNQFLFIVVGIIVTVEFIFLIVWTAVDHPEAVTDVIDDDAEDTLATTCDSDDTFWIIWLCIQGTLILVGTILTFLVRNLPDEFNDAWPLGVSMYNIFFILAASIGVGWGLSHEPSAVVFIQGFSIIIAIGVMLIFLFGPVLLSILRGKPPREYKSSFGGGSSGGLQLSGLSSGGTSHTSTD